MTKLSLWHSNCGKGWWPEASRLPRHSVKVAGDIVGSAEVSQAALRPPRAVWGDHVPFIPTLSTGSGEAEVFCLSGFTRSEK